MIISQEDDSSFEGEGTDKAFLIDETSMGEPWTEFGRWFGQRYCGAPGILEQLHGIKGHNYIELTNADITAIKEAFNSMEHRDDLTENLLFKFLDEHKDKHISTENW